MHLELGEVFGYYLLYIYLRKHYQDLLCIRLQSRLEMSCAKICYTFLVTLKIFANEFSCLAITFYVRVSQTFVTFLFFSWNMYCIIVRDSTLFRHSSSSKLCCKREISFVKVLRFLNNHLSKTCTNCFNSVIGQCFRL